MKSAPEPADEGEANDDPGIDIEPREAGQLDGEQGEVVDGEFAPENRRVHYERHFAGPLPSPEMLAQNESILPGLAREIVDQWKGETAHRQETVTQLRRTDHQAMEHFYAAEKRGQNYALAAFLAMLMVAALALVLSYPKVGGGALLVGGGGIIWAMRRRSGGPDGGSGTTDLADGNEVELRQPTGDEEP
jgi:uncharacterized membrane protein